MAYFKYKDKNVFYEEIGTGIPVVLLHGNSVSSKMFTGIIDLYWKDYKLILIDFLGHGKSDRLDQFSEDFWYDQAMQVIQLLTLKHYRKVNLIGTSGGALAALNIALEREDLVNKVIADSLEGEEALDGLINTIYGERQKTKSQKQVCMFWKYCHGEDWEQVVDNDTDVIIRHGKYIKKFFHRDLSKLQVPVMFTASLADDEYAGIIDIGKTYMELMKKVPSGRMHLFQMGGHPAMITNAEEFADLTKDFFVENCSE